MKKVEVRWVDSLQGNGKWRWIKKIDFEDIEKHMFHISVGFLIKENRNLIALTSSYQESEYEDGDKSIEDPFIIPKVAIKKITKLK